MWMLSFKMMNVHTARYLELCRFRQALSAAMGLAQAANRYLDVKEPWRTRRTDLERTATTLWVCLSVLSCLRTITYPYLPFSAQRLHEMLGYEGNVQDSGWKLAQIPVGKSFGKPAHLFTKLDDSVADEEQARLQAAAK